MSDPLPLVLIADNDEGVRSLLAEVCRRQRLAVEEVADGESARHRLERGGIAVLVCDLDMPRQAGAEVLEWLDRQANPAAAIVVSGYVDRAVQEQLQGLAVVRSVLRKPFDIVAFGRLVAEHARPGGWSTAATP